MPSVKVKVDKVIGFKKDTGFAEYLTRSVGLSYNVYGQLMPKDEELLLSSHICFLMNSQIEKYIPENAFIKRVELNVYVTNNKFLGISSDEVIPNYFASVKTDSINSPNLTWENDIIVNKRINFGWNSFDITSYGYRSKTNVLWRLSKDFISKGTDKIFYYGDTLKYGGYYDNLKRDIIRTVYDKTGIFIKNELAEPEKVPYLEIEYEYKLPESAETLNPNSITVNTRTPIRFSWNSKIEQKAFEIQYRVNGSTWQSITKTTSERFYDMPAGTIRESSGTVEWKVRVMEESGVYSDWTEATFTIGTVPQPVPRLSSPVGDYIKNGKPITFEWDFVKNTVEEQKAYEIEISLPNETKTIKETSPNTSHTVDLKITDSIVVYWKMRVQNNFDDWSDWTERVSFQTIGIPPAPQIMSIDNSNRPTVKWNSREQEAFKLSVEDMKGNVVFKTKDILGATTREYKIDKVIPNGKYLFKLSILNAYAIYSEITEYTHIIEPTPIEKPIITIYKSNYFVEVTSDYLEGEVLRDGKVIGKLKDGKFRDYTGANYKTYSYQVRVFKDDVVGLSDKKGCVTEFGEFNTLATVDKLDNFFLIKYGLNESIKKVYSFEVQGAAISLEGKKYPFYEFDNHARASFNLSFYLESMNQVIKLQSLVEKKKEFLLRENRGTNRQGTIQGVNVEYDVLGYLVTCTLIITGEDYE